MFRLDTSKFFATEWAAPGAVCLIEADEDEPDGALAEIQLADLLPKPFTPRSFLIDACLDSDPRGAELCLPRHFCSWDCLLKQAAETSPVEAISAASE